MIMQYCVEDHTVYYIVDAHVVEVRVGPWWHRGITARTWDGAEALQSGHPTGQNLYANQSWHQLNVLQLSARRDALLESRRITKW